MGGDGGSIQGRDVLVKTKQRTVITVDPHKTAEQRINTCAISGKQLLRPVVACEMGNIFNKDAIIEHLLAKKDLPQFRHIRGLKDLIECKIKFESDLKLNEDSKRPQEAREGSISYQSSGIDHIVCPLTEARATGVLPFIVMRHCGCVMSLKGYKDMTKNDVSLCPACEKPVGPLDNVPPEKTTEVKTAAEPTEEHRLTSTPAPEESKSTTGVQDSTSSSPTTDEWSPELPYIILCSTDVAVLDSLRNVMTRKRQKAKSAKQDRKRARTRDSDHAEHASGSAAGVEVSQPLKRVELLPNVTSAEALKYAQYTKEAEKQFEEQKRKSAAIASLFTSSCPAVANPATPTTR